MRILGILLCCLILGLSTVAFAEQPTTVFSKVVATKNMQGEIPEIDGLRYTNLQKSVKRHFEQQSQRLAGAGWRQRYSQL